MTYGNGLFVAVGNQTTILTSPNGINWIAQTAGTTSPTLWSAAYGNGRYVLGGGEGALIRSSTDGVHWTNGLFTIGTENIRGITFGYGSFVAVGHGTTPNSGYILTSPDGLNWAVQSAPTTNTLFDVSPAFGPTGIGWADQLYVAVGDLGTILTSTDGTNWVVRNSGTTVPLRTVVFHQGGFLIGGDMGTVLKSSDGVTWPAVAPTSFNVRAMASSGFDAVVAVGNYTTTGQLQASVDGLSWPGSSTSFSQPLNGIAYGGGTFVAAGNGGLIIQSAPAAGATNDWTKSTSGYWEEPFWSLGRLPAIDQSLVAFRNPGFKALAIGTNTTTSFADSLSIHSLLVEAPADSFNQLLLNYPGLSVPLDINSDFVLGTNASLVGYYSALRGGNFYLSGPAALSVGSTIQFSQINVGAIAPGELDLTNAFLSTDLLILSDQAAGTLVQSGGTNKISSLQMNAGSSYTLDSGTLNANSLDLASQGPGGFAQFTMSGGSMNVLESIKFGQSQFVTDAEGDFQLFSGDLTADEMDFANGKFTQVGGTATVQKLALPYLEFTRGDYLLLGGTLLSSNVALGQVLNPSSLVNVSTLQQSGGVHTNSNMQLYGEIRHQAVNPFGSYSLSSGLLASSNITLIGGSFTQTGGTNLTQELVVQDAGSFIISDSTLITSNTTVDSCCLVQSRFIQNSGSYTVQNRLLLENLVNFELRGGTLNVSNIELGGVCAEFRVEGGTISNSGRLILRGGAVRTAGQNLQFGQLQINGDPTLTCFSSTLPGPILDVGSIGAPGTTLRFADSHTVPWSGTALFILNWSPTSTGSGPDHIFVGTNAQGLTAAQVSQLTFVNPVGWPPGNFPAAILSTGEIVPAVLPPLTYIISSNKLILFWSGDAELLAATNVVGPYLLVPGATSPSTNMLSDDQRYFRVRLREAE